MRFSTLLVLVLLQTFSGRAQAQSKSKQPFILGLNYHYGFLLNHAPARTDIHSAALTGMNALELSIQWQTLGTKPWHHNYNFPSWGMSLIYYNVDNRVIRDIDVAWGKGIAWLIYKNIRLIRTPFFKLNLRLGTGFAHFTQPYDAKTNPGNLWISSPINASLHINLETKYRVSDKVNLVLGGTFTHYSNGALMMPNLGVNFPSVNVGIHYTPHPEWEVYQKDSIMHKYKKNFFHFSVGVGAKVLADFGTTYYPALAISAHYGRRLGKVSKVFGGLDFFRDYSLLDSTNKANHTDISRLGIFIGHEFMFGRLGLISGVGRYIYKKTSRDPDYYIKAGLRYHFHTNFYGEVILKTHYGQADNIEWTIGYTL